MSANIGIWIDDEKAVIVSSVETERDLDYLGPGYEITNFLIDGSPEDDFEVKIIESGKTGEKVLLPEERSRYYKKVVSCLETAKYVFIFGPGQAKRDLRKEISCSAKTSAKVVSTHPAEEMTLNQIIVRVRRYFAVPS